MWKWLLLIVLILAGSCIGGGVWLQTSGKLKELQDKYSPGAKGVTVRIAPASRGELVRTVQAQGQIEPKTKVEISAQVSARIVEMPFDENDVVRKGDVVIRLDDRDLQAALDSARASLKSQEAQLARAEAEFQRQSTDLGRVRELFASKDVSRSELDEAETNYARAEASLKSATFSIDIARATIRQREKDVDNAVVRAPFDGVITKRNAEVGELVVVGTLNNAGSVIMEIADLTVMLLKARVDEANVAALRDRQKARIFVNAYRDLVFDGMVERVSLKRQIDRDGTGYFETEVMLTIPEGVLMRSGLTANAEIAVQTFSNALKLPSQAVQERAIDDLPVEVTRDNPWVDKARKYARVVFVARDDGTVRAAPVKTGASDITDTVIEEGLDEGAKIVVGPFKALADLKHGDKFQDESALPKDENHTVGAGGPSKGGA